MEGLMRHTAILAAMLLGILFLPVCAQGQSHSSAPSSTTPAWVRHAWEEGSHVLPYAIDVNDEDEVYVTKVVQDPAYHYDHDGLRFVYVQGNFIVSYDANGLLRWERAGSAPREETRFFNTFAGYDIAARNDRIYTNEGVPIALDTEAHGYIHPGGIMINTYAAADGDSLRTMFIGEFPDNIQYTPVRIQGLGLDQAANIYLVGTYHADSLFSAPHALAGFPVNDRYLSALGRADIFLASYTPEGAIRWTRRIGGSELDLVYRDEFAVDVDGNTYFHGYSGGNAVFGEGQPNEATFEGGIWDSFDFPLASFNAEGDLRWVRTRYALDFDTFELSPHRLAVDDDGHLLIGWHHSSPSDFPRLKPGSTITKSSQDGAILWSQQLLADNVHIAGIETDAMGHVYVGGSFLGGPLQLGDRMLHSPNHVQPSGEDGFVAHFDAEGNLRWAGLATGPGSQVVTAIAVGPSGDFYVAGKFHGTLYLGPEQLEQTGGEANMFVAKYDAATITSSETTPELPSAATLMSNYPNPFTHATTIEYALPASGHVHLSVYDVLGREVAILVDGVQHAGKHASVFDAASLPSGTYVYRLEASGQVRTGLMTLMK